MPFDENTLREIEETCVDKHARYRLLPLQQGILFHSNLITHSPYYLNQIVIELPEAVQCHFLELAIRRVVDRHEVLRALIDEIKLEFIVKKALPIELKEIDFSRVNEKKEAMQQWLDQDKNTMFDLSNPPLIRFNLLKRSENDYLLVITYHHILMGGASTVLMVKEIFQFYDAFLNNVEPRIDPPVPYEKCISHLQWSEKNEAKRYWSELLDSYEQVPRLPEFDIKQENKYSMVQNPFILDSQVYKNLKKFAKKHHTTLNIILQLGWGLLLAHYCNSEDIVFGVTREFPRKWTKNTLGLFINTLPVRLQFQKDKTIENFLIELKIQHRQQIKFVNTPLSTIQSCTQLPAGSALFSTLFDFKPADPDRIMQKLYDNWSPRSGTFRFDTHYPLLIETYENDSSLCINLHFNSGLFDEKFIHQLIKHYQHLLNQLSRDIKQQALKIPLIIPEERQQLIRWNDTKADYPKDKTVHALFSLKAKQFPDRIAASYENRSLMYRELDEQSDFLAAYLKKQGVEIGVPIVLYVERDLSLLVGILGIMKAGAYYIPIDPNYPAERIATILQDCDSHYVLTQNILLKKLKHYLAQFSIKTTLISLDDKAIYKASESITPLSHAGPQDAVYAIYTSGSTGKPKGALNSHRSLVNVLTWMQKQYQLTRKDRVLQKTSIGFDISFWELFWPLISGAQVVLAPLEVEQDSGKLVRTIQKMKITHLHFSPSALQVFLSISDLSALHVLKQVLSIGEVLSSSLTQAFFKKFPTVKLTNLYGPVEAAIEVTYWDCDLADTRKTIPIGQPIANAKLCVVNSHDQLVGPYLSGELYIGGIPVATGYLNRPALTQERFVELDFLGTTERWYKTGDVVRWMPDGNLEYLWRTDDQIKLRGFRIELGEIEQVLSQCPLIRRACVITQGSDLNQYMVVYFTANQPVNTEKIRQYLLKKLPVHMVPTVYQQLEQLPLNRHGKIDKMSLSFLVLSVSKSSKTKIVSDNVIKQTIIDSWKKILGLSASSSLYKEDNFFNMGGNSLTAIQIAAYLNTRLSLSLKPNVLFDYPVLDQLIEYVESCDLMENKEELLMSLVTVTPRPKKIPLSFAQQRLWFLDQLHPNQTSYNLFVALKITGDLDTDVLQQAFNALFRRHEILRTTFFNQGGEVSQLIHTDKNLSIKIEHIDDKNQNAYQKIYAEAQTHFDLEKGPLIRAVFFICSDKEYILTMTLHHIICDGWSMNLLGKELSSLYIAIRENQLHQVMPVAFQYADYALWTRKQLTDQYLAPQIAYWRQQLSQAPVLNLPTDYPRPTIQEFKGKHLNFQLDIATTNQLKKIATDQNTTLFNVLMSAFEILLMRYSSQHDIVLGTPIAGRQYPDTENIIGLFVNTLVLRTQLHENDSFIDLVKKNHDILKSAHANQEVPFEKLVEHLRLNRDMSRHPLCQVMIVMQNFDIHSLHIPNTTIERVFSDNDTLLLSDYESSKFDLTLYLQDNKEKIYGLLEYNTTLFKKETVQRFQQNFIQLLSNLVESPSIPVLDLPLLTDREQQLLQTWNDTEHNYSKATHIIQLFEQQVKKSPEHTAVLFKDRKMTYNALNASANQLAHYLSSKLTNKHFLIGICLDRSIEMVVSILAIMKAGFAYMPIDTCSPKQRLKYIIEDSQVPLILTSKPYKEKLDALVPTHAEVLTLEALEAELVQCNQANLDCAIAPTDFSYAIYTSGSTGKPKGVLNQHRGTLNRLLWMQKTYPLIPNDRVLQKTSISFDVSVWEIFWPLSAGATTVLAEPGKHKDANYLADTIQNHQVTVLHFVPSMLSSFLEYNHSNKMHSLKRVFVSGEVLTIQLQKQFFSLFKHIPLHNLYGPTEASIDVTYFNCDLNQKSIPIGKPISNTKIYIIDSRMNLVPIGVAGEICIAGDGVAWGYLNQDAITREKFIDNPFDSGRYAKMYRTGDLGRWLADGNIEYIDRIDRQMKIRGFRVEPAEIEAALLMHTSIQKAIVIQKTNPSSQQLVAYLVLNAGAQHPEFSVLRRFLKQHLPSYMIPNVFTILDDIPLTASGKVDWQDLALAKTTATLSSSKEIVSAENDMHQKLVAIWSQSLNVKPDMFGIHHDFFELGGHSLLALKIISEIQTTFEVKISTRDFFMSSTISQLGQLIQEKLLEKAIHKNNLVYITKPHSPLVTLQPDGDKTPIFLFHPVGGTVFCYMPLVSYLRKDRPCYAIQDPGIEASQPLYKTIREMSADYLDIVKSVQPTGPYILGGSSFGGTVAVEMAYQLIQSGEKIAFLPLLDLWALFTDEFRSRKRLEAGMLRQFNMLKKRLDTENVPNPEPWLELNWHRMNLWLNYKPPVVDTQLSLFKATTLLPEYIPIEDPYNHWQQYSTYPVITHRIPGDHETMHLEPNAQVLAQCMQQCLDHLKDVLSNAIFKKESECPV